MNVLVVEDNVSTNKIIAESIERQHHKVEIAHTCRDALKKVIQKKFDLVLLDIFLPDCMGYELIPQFKERWHDMGIVTITDRHSQDLECKVRKLGILYYMTKPFAMEEINDILEHTEKRIGMRLKNNGRISKKN